MFNRNLMFLVNHLWGTCGRIARKYSYLLFAPLCFGIVACGGDDDNYGGGDNNGGSTNNGSGTNNGGGENNKDIKEQGFFYVTIAGTAKVDEVTKYALIGIAVEYADNAQFQNSKKVWATSISENNDYEIDVTGLKPSTTYYYRIVQRTTMEKYGETKQFKTKTLDRWIVYACTIGEPEIYSEKIGSWEGTDNDGTRYRDVTIAHHAQFFQDFTLTFSSSMKNKEIESMWCMPALYVTCSEDKNVLDNYSGSIKKDMIKTEKILLGSLYNPTIDDMGNLTYQNSSGKYAGSPLYLGESHSHSILVSGIKWKTTDSSYSGTETLYYRPFISFNEGESCCFIGETKKSKVISE